MVSPKHANFLVNVGSASAADVEQLVAFIQTVVKSNSVSASALDAGIPHRRGGALMRLRHDPKIVRHVTEAREFGRVAVLLGGTSTEREISLISGNACLRRCVKRGVDAHPFDPRDKPLSELITRKFDRVFIALHGPGGEDGTLQGALEFLGLPYTGSGVMGSAIGMDKLRTKRLAQSVGIPTTEYMVLRSPADLDNCVERLGLPLIVKPATQGSSVGMTKVERREDLAAAYQAASLLEPSVFAEAWITGAEYTVAILQGRALPSIRIETPATFYDYQAKYFRNDTKYFCPSGLSTEAEKHLANLSLATFAAVGRRGLGPRRLHDGQDRQALPARDQHRSRHDRSQPRADGGARARHQLRTARVAGARDQLHAHGGERVIWGKAAKQESEPAQGRRGARAPLGRRGRARRDRRGGARGARASPACSRSARSTRTSARSP